MICFLYLSKHRQCYDRLVKTLWYNSWYRAIFVNADVDLNFQGQLIRYFYCRMHCHRCIWHFVEIDPKIVEIWAKLWQAAFTITLIYDGTVIPVIFYLIAYYFPIHMKNIDGIVPEICDVFTFSMQQIFHLENEDVFVRQLPVSVEPKYPYYGL